MFRAPLFRAPLMISLRVLPYLALFSEMFICIRLNKDMGPLTGVH